MARAKTAKRPQESGAAEPTDDPRLIDQNRPGGLQRESERKWPQDSIVQGGNLLHEIGRCRDHEEDESSACGDRDLRTPPPG